MRPALLALALVLAGCTGSGDPASSPTVSAGGPPVTAGAGALEAVASGFEAPLYVTHAGDGSGRLFVVEQAGRVRVVAPGGAVQAEPFLDLTDRVGSEGSEQGLLGLAFLPDFAATGTVVASYTDRSGDTVLSRLRLAPGGARLDPASEEVLLQVDQPFPNHNGGHVLFGPDGQLYVGLGDGGAAGDPGGNGQNRQTLLGDLLRIGVGAEGPYTVPPDNPYVGDPTARPEVWASGLRNPWRFHFDAATGDLWIGDVGQDAFEEVNVQPAAVGGLNYGWNLFEGSHHWPSMAPVPVAVPGFTFPAAEYDHGGGRCSVTQGPVVRGGPPQLEGRVLYADYCSGTVWSLDAAGGEPQVLLEAGFPVSSFGEGPEGEVFLLDYGAGRLLRLAGT